MTTATETPALDELDERYEAIEEARQRVAELEEQTRAAKRSLDEALAPLQDYYRAIEAGTREPDGGEETRLQQAVDDARAAVAPQAVYNPRAGIGEGLRVEMANPELEGKLKGARERLTTAERQLDRFMRTRFDDLVVELGTLGTELAERSAPIFKHARRAQAEWRDLRERWRPLVELGGFTWADFPSRPFGDLSDTRPLMPRQLAEGESLGAPSPPLKRRKA